MNINFATKWPIGRQHALAPAIVFILSLFAYGFNDQLANLFVYNRNDILLGQWWRLISGHFFHTNTLHFILNSAALFLIWALHGYYYSIKNYSIIFLSSCLFISLAMLEFSPNLIEYVGLSGVLHAVFVWGALQDIFHKEKTGYLLFIGVILKVAHEQLFGASDSIKQLIGANVAIDAHLYGLISGMLLFVGYYIMVIKRQSHG